MTTFKQSIRIEYKPLSTSDSVATLSGNQRQSYNVDTGYFHPDRRLDPLTILVTCNVYDAHGLIAGVINESLTDVVWKITSAQGVMIAISGSDTQFKIGSGVDKGKITVYKNINDLEESTLEFTARYMEPKSKRVVSFQRTISLVTVTEAAAPVQLALNAPIGTVQFPFVNSVGLMLEAELSRNGQKVPAAYWWKKDGVELVNEASERLVVTNPTKAGNVFEVEVADCTSKFNELVDAKVESDPEVVEWRGLYEGEGKNVFARSSQLNLNPSLNYLTRIDIINGKRALVFESSNNIAFLGALPYRLIHGSTYTFSFYAMSNIDGLNLGRVYINAYNAVFLQGQRITTDWVRYSFSFVANNDSAVQLHMYPGINLGNGIYNSFYITDWKLENNELTNWSPEKGDFELLLSTKYSQYISHVSLPVGYRPNPKPSNTLKKQIFLKRSLGAYECIVLYPKVVDPDSTSVKFEAVFSNNKGVIENAGAFFDVGWWKKSDGNYEFKGLNIDVPMGKLQQMIDAGKGVEYTIIEK